jgi:hypothetical protein
MIENPNEQFNFHFNRSLGNKLLYRAVSNAPFRTGNLANSIRLAVCTKRKISINYDASMAYYTYFLEEGKGNIKRYRGFISDVTVPWIIEDIVTFFEYGEDFKGIDKFSKSSFISDKAKALGGSRKAQPMFYEKGKITKTEKRTFGIVEGSSINRQQRNRRSLLQYHKMMRPLTME